MQPTAITSPAIIRTVEKSGRTVTIRQDGHRYILERETGARLTVKSESLVDAYVSLLMLDNNNR